MSPRMRLAVGAVAWLACALVLALAPIGAYSATLATEAIILSLWAVSYNLVYGYMGEISFGHAAFLGWARSAWRCSSATSACRSASIWSAACWPAACSRRW